MKYKILCLVQDWHESFSREKDEENKCVSLEAFLVMWYCFHPHPTPLWQMIPTDLGQSFLRNMIIQKSPLPRIANSETIGIPGHPKSRKFRFINAAKVKPLISSGERTDHDLNVIARNPSKMRPTIFRAWARNAKAEPITTTQRICVYLIGCRHFLAHLSSG